MVDSEVKENIVVPETLAKAQQFTTRVMQAINNYGAVLRKKGTGVRTPEAKTRPAWHWDYLPIRKRPVPGPGRGGIL